MKYLLGHVFKYF